jgi:hypothetical protein
MQQTTAHILARAHQIRRRLEHERRQPGAPSSRLLRLQALLLRAQRQLADLIEPAAPRPVPVLAKP